MKYRAGHGEERFTVRSVEYCRRARNHLAAIGSPLASAALPLLTPASPRAQLARQLIRAGIAPEAGSGAPSSQSVSAAVQSQRSESYRKLWAEHVARVRKIDAAIARIVPGG